MEKEIGEVEEEEKWMKLEIGEEECIQMNWMEKEQEEEEEDGMEEEVICVTNIVEIKDNESHLDIGKWI